jgi:thiamine-monophosphate kinase
LLRSGACVGDDVYVSGTLGDANLALRTLLGELALPANALQNARNRLEQPTPRIALGQALRGLASACADISDGLVGDLGHILEASGVGATVNTANAMQLVALGAIATRAEDRFDLNISKPALLQSVLSGGDDYELVFTAAPALRAEISAAATSSQTPVTRIGRIDSERGLRLVDAGGAIRDGTFTAFDHFAR